MLGTDFSTQGLPLLEFPRGEKQRLSIPRNFDAGNCFFPRTCLHAALMSVRSGQSGFWSCSRVVGSVARVRAVQIGCGVVGSDPCQLLLAFCKHLLDPCFASLETVRFQGVETCSDY